MSSYLNIIDTKLCASVNNTTQRCSVTGISV